MTSNEEHRLRFHALLIALGLEPESADAILMSMTPFPWDEVAKQADMAAMRGDMLAMQGDIAAMQGGMALLESDVAVLKTDVAVLKTDVAVLKTDVAVLKTDVAVLKTDVRELKTDVAANTSELVQLRGEFDGFRMATDANFGSVFRHLDGLDVRFGELTSEMRSGFADVRAEMGGLRTDIRTVLLALVGFILAVVLAGGTAAVTLLA